MILSPAFLCGHRMCVVSQLFTPLTILFSFPGIIQLVSAYLGIDLVFVQPSHLCRLYVMQCILILLNLIYDLECAYFRALSAILLKSLSIISTESGSPLCSLCLTVSYVYIRLQVVSRYAFSSFNLMVISAILFHYLVWRKIVSETETCICVPATVGMITSMF
jgi:hypothetical protein